MRIRNKAGKALLGVYGGMFGVGVGFTAAGMGILSLVGFSTYGLNNLIKANLFRFKDFNIESEIEFINEMINSKDFDNTEPIEILLQIRKQYLIEIFHKYEEKYKITILNDLQQNFQEDPDMQELINNIIALF